MANSCNFSLDIRQELAGIDSIHFTFYINKEKPLKVLFKDKHYRRNFVNSLSIENIDIDKKKLQKTGKIIFKKINVGIDLLEGNILTYKNQFYFQFQFKQKEYIRQINKEGIEIIEFVQQFPEVAEGFRIL
ncbi:MAG: hypothetical protein EAZ85_11375 [Bacteroidetes bacterium]|nr:MAG: hypothetical protein EAZ85_11375 [Bacteroidota bacterium]TAG87838.1 MAG: hypothetical protein EAZ20_09800 [Bacteroidota bacterium]